MGLLVQFDVIYRSETRCFGISSFRAYVERRNRFFPQPFEDLEYRFEYRKE